MKVQVCVGSNCILLGSMNILDQLEELQDLMAEDLERYSAKESLEIEAVKCLGYCKLTSEAVAPLVIVDGEAMFKATSQGVMEKVVNKLRKV